MWAKRGGLWLPRDFSMAENRRAKRTVTLPTGERALMSVDDSGTVMQIETAERMDAVARPRTVRLQLRRG
jgi:hypothetical protein